MTVVCLKYVNVNKVSYERIQFYYCESKYKKKPHANEQYAHKIFT